MDFMGMFRFHGGRFYCGCIGDHRVGNIIYQQIKNKTNWFKHKNLKKLSNYLCNLLLSYAFNKAAYLLINSFKEQQRNSETTSNQP